MSWKFRMLTYSILQRLIGFHRWHVLPMEQRPYCLEIIKSCNKILEMDTDVLDGKVIEVGCGLGDILANIIKVKKENKLGYDIDTKVIKAARIVHPGIRFIVGEFAPNIRDEKISIFITVNFLYSLDCGKVEREYRKLIENNDIKYIVTEEMHPSTNNYPYSHNFNTILENKYKLVRKRCFAANEHSRRHILYYKKVKLMD